MLVRCWHLGEHILHILDSCSSPAAFFTAKGLDLSPVKAGTRLMQSLSEFEVLRDEKERMLLSRCNNMSKTTRTSESHSFFCHYADIIPCGSFTCFFCYVVSFHINCNIKQPIYCLVLPDVKAMWPYTQFWSTWEFRMTVALQDQAVNYCLSIDI